DAVLPEVAGDEVAARVPHGADAELLDQVDDVMAEAVGVSGGVLGVVDAGVDAATEVLDERPEGPPPNRPDDVRRVEREGCGSGHVSFSMCGQSVGSRRSSRTPWAGTAMVCS